MNRLNCCVEKAKPADAVALLQVLWGQLSQGHTQKLVATHFALKYLCKFNDYEIFSQF